MNMLVNKLKIGTHLIFTFVLSLLLIFIALPQSALAISAKQQALYKQNILYYDLDTGCDSATVNAVAPTTSKKAYMLGDSITLGSKDKLISGFSTKGVSLTVNASVGRSITRPGTTEGNRISGLQALDSAADKAAIKDADMNTVIIALGTNGEGSPAQFKASLQRLLNKFKALKDGMNYYVVNIFSPIVTQKAAYNSMLNDFASTGGFTVIDTTNQHITVAGDNTHPDEEGKQTFANTVVNAVAGGTAAASADTAPAVGGNCSCNVAGATTTSLSGNDNDEKVWNFLIGKGLQPIPAAGIMGNLAIESHFDPSIQEGGQSPPYGGYGIAQWTGTGKAGDPAGARRLNLIKAVQKAGIAVDLGTQVAKDPIDNDKLLAAELDYLWTEGASALAQIRKETTVQGAVQSWMDNFERARVRVQPDRYAAGQAALTKFGGGGGGGATVTTVSSPSAGASCSSVSGGADSAAVNADGYALPVQKEGVNLPCGRATCHHDGTPAADLGITPAWEGRPVFAIVAGKIDNMHYRAGPSGNAPSDCISLHIVGEDGWDYWYGHIRNPLVKNGDNVKAGQKIAEIGESACADNTPPHLHIDRGSPKGAGGGNECCRDPGFIPLLDKIYQETP